MPYPRETPYDLLDIPPTATARDIVAAYPRALAAKRQRAGEVQHAFNELRNPRRRLEHDLLLFCNLGGAADLEQLVSDYGRVSLPALTAEPVPVGPTLTDLGMGRYAQDYRPPPRREARLAARARYANPAWDLLPVILDR
ncbi:MAG: hypothetical protein K6V36_01040 [Anaerolineae bacterium]|nr:hypothetical protein [Anaerolineae bacterium]